MLSIIVSIVTCVHCCYDYDPDYFLYTRRDYCFYYYATITATITSTYTMTTAPATDTTLTVASTITAHTATLCLPLLL
jgi:hypothetical protein